MFIMSRPSTNRKGVDFNNNHYGALVLNSGYEPLTIISWQKAMILWLQDKVDVVEYYSVSINSATRSFQLPSILRLKKYVKTNRNKKVRLNRRNLFLRDKFICAYCDKKFSEKNLTIDHVIPLSKGGAHSWDNVVTSCSKCNNKKGNRLLSDTPFKS